MTIKVFDTFVGTTGSITGHTPDTDVEVGGWSSNQAGVVIDGSGGLQVQNGTGCWINSGVTDQIVTANYNQGGAANNVILVVRRDVAAQGSRDCYEAVFRASNNDIILRRVDTGSTTNLSITDFTFSSSTTYELELSIVSDAIEIKIDTVSIETWTDAIHSAGGYAGVSGHTMVDAALRVYDFTVEDVVTAASITSVGGDDVVLDAETPAFITTGFSSEISTVQLIGNGSGTAITNGSSVSSTSGAGTFSLPDITLYTGDVIGCPLTTANNIVVARLTDA